MEVKTVLIVALMIKLIRIFIYRKEVARTMSLFRQKKWKATLFMYYPLYVGYFAIEFNKAQTDPAPTFYDNLMSILAFLLFTIVAIINFGIEEKSEKPNHWYERF